MDISGLIGVRNFETANGGVTEGKALTTGEVVGTITEGANIEVDALGGISKGDTVEAISKPESSAAVGTISAGEVVGIITKGDSGSRQ